ncbi:uncharacterized protein LOC135848316 [Planococcus citri]|uniref:uncharacterized protein LOC135848316 n=1 Tax=Planococcus citri TaxID=170843 RepID=UPI0031F81A64
MTVMGASTMYTAVIILLGINLFISVKSDANSSTYPETNVKTLPQRWFPQPLRELLSPDIFTQVDPFNYLRQKAMKLKFGEKEDMRNALYVYSGKVPSAYTPYAELLRSMLACFINLDHVKIFIMSAKRDKFSNPLRPPPDPSALDSVLSPLFSLDVFLDNDPPSVLIDKLLTIPETSFSSIARILRNPTDDASRQLVKFYPWYSVDLSRFLQNELALMQLKDLQRSVAKIKQLKLNGSEDGQIKEK